VAGIDGWKDRRVALISCDFFSDVLKVSTSITVVLPQQTRAQIGMTGVAAEAGRARVLYLLHGLSDDHTTWQRRTSIERYAAELGLAVVMPAVHRSFYTDEVHGHRYWTFLSQELPRLVSSFFRVSDRPEDTYVAGLSMGGYGALKWALREPSRFAAAASMSGALDVAGMARRPDRDDLFDRVFGGAPGPDDDLFALLRSADPDALPPLHISCGTEDPLLVSNAAFVRDARTAGARVTVDFRPGRHEWGFWDAEIQKILGWLPSSVDG
jgi:putative tributyrin esterase